MQDKEDVLNQSQKEAELGLAVPSFQEVLIAFVQTIPTEVDDMIVDVQEFCSPQQECPKRQQKQTTPCVRTSIIGKRIPLFTPLFISSSTHYRLIMRLMNVCWASILASWIQNQVW